MAQGFAWMAYAEAVEAAASRAAYGEVSSASSMEDGQAGVDVLPNGGVLLGSFLAVACRPEFSWPCDWAVATVRCETGGTFDPYAHGHEEYRGVYYHFLGPWQIAVTTHEGNDWLYDMYANTVEAHLKYAASGTAPWPVCGH